METVWSTEVDSILGRGIWLGHNGTQNWALKKDQALNALNELNKISVGILAGDVYKQNDGKIDHTYGN